MDEYEELIFRNALYILLEYESIDGYTIRTQFKDIRSRDVCEKLCKRLEKAGCISDWHLQGRDGFNGQIHREKVIKAIEEL